MLLTPIIPEKSHLLSPMMHFFCIYIPIDTMQWFSLAADRSSYLLCRSRRWRAECCFQLMKNILFVVAHQYSVLYSFERQTKRIPELTIIDIKN